MIAMRRVALLVCVLLLSGLAWAETGSPVRIVEPATINLADVATVYPDTQGRLSPEDVIENLRRGEEGLAVLPEGFSETIWLAVPLINETAEDRWVLKIRQALLVGIDLWLFSEGRIVLYENAGIAQDRPEAQPEFALGYRFSLDLPPGSGRTLIVRLEPLFFLASTPTLAPISQAHVDTALRRMLFPLLLGTYLGIAGLHIIVFLRFGGISNLFFVGAVVGVFSDWFVWLGGASDIWPGLSVTQLLAIADVTWLAATFFILVFCIDFLSSDKRRPLPYVAVLLPYVILMMILFNNSDPELYVSALLFYLLLTAAAIYLTGYYAIRRGLAGARLALIAYSIGLASELSAYIGLVVPWLDGFRDWFASTLGIFDVPTLLSQVLLNGLFSMALWEQVRARVREREAAVRAHRARSVHLAQLCHDIRSPLHAVLSVVGALSARGSDSIADPRHVEAIRSSVRSIAGVLDDIVDTARTGRPRRSRKGAVDIRELAEDAAAVARSEVDGKAVTVEMAIADDVPQLVESDGVALQRILGNLLSNAARETDRGSIRISISRPDAQANRLLVELADTGPGLSEDRLRSLSESGPAVDEGSDALSGGMGLRVVKRLVAAIGGRLAATSRPQLGTTIWFEFPAPAVASEGETETAADFPVIRGLRLLLVEDEPLTAAATTALLITDGQEVVQAATVQDAVRLAADRAFDLVLMDLDLGGRSGLTAIRAIRRLRNPVRAAVPIIVLTGDRKAGEEACRAPFGIQSGLVKPFDFTALRLAIARAAGLAPLSPAEINGGARTFFDDLAETLGSADLDRLLETAREQIGVNLEALETAVQAGRLRDAQRAAHRLAGAAAIVGVTDLTEAARRAEKAAHDRDRRTLATALHPVRESARIAQAKLQHWRRQDNGAKRVRLNER